jgi:hypothetical protein
MTHPNTTRFSTRLRLLCGLALLLGLCIMLGGLARPAHAQSTLSVSDCSSDAQLQAAVAQANSDNAGDVITFACSGDIKLTSTLSINGSMTLSGSGQSVTLDGGDSVGVLSVNSGRSLTLNTLTIAHGSGPGFDGGGLFNGGGTVSISNSTFANNSAADGGGLFNFGTVSINNSTFANNSSYYRGGGGLENGGGTVSISNSTFAYNSANGGEGGGLDSQDGTVTISNSTIANNSGSDGGGLDLWRGTMTISNSTVANNSPDAMLSNIGTVSFSGSIVLGGCATSGGTWTDNGYNLDNDHYCFSAATSLHADPKLGPLASNGGPTQTMALQDGSPAIDAIPLSANLCPGTDQRGQGRPDTGESRCDMGAYEFADPADKDLGLSNMPADLTVNATSPKGAVVTYTPPKVVDESGESSTASVSCTPASGSTFAIGTTKVTCTASDSDDTNSPVSGSFTVTVKGAAAQVSDLVNTVNSFHLSSSLQNALDNKLKDTLTAINAGQTTTACSELTDFSGYVQSHTGKGLTSSQATQLIAAARQVQAVLGC